MMSPSIVNVDTSGCILTAPIDVHQITKVAPDLWLPPISWEDVGGGAKFPQLPRPKVWLINSTLLPSSASVGTNFDFFLWIEELKGVSTANIALYLYVPKKCAMLKRHEVGFTNDTTVVIYSDEFINRWPFCQLPAPSAFRSSPRPPSDVHRVFGHLGVSKKEGVSFFALKHMSWC